ncbi:hypothetical protein COY33_01330 [candidate division WWE3 bacterium CG_4_10_14_0_2_um_filter_42_7]|uniref:DUF948 domain-containing protein n=2 Tax=Katanobacteria TaxID=422282 RepID=A0A2H0XCJ9_UNCKA|nr:MAG: hypothetical protein COT51_00530 [candidate division WWE3 bacterium CG08_land_8_20_14_0_20_41_15]PIZ43556.1 MAG: hypothetical protein COY33_01330 [candidate division WWE3 bacterium CG_4_10_14_0_2_um_filter_42_7]
MANTTLLILIITLLTLNLLMVGVYIILVLKEVRETVKKTNKILDDVDKMTAAISTPVADAAGIFAALTGAVKAFKAFKILAGSSSEEDEEDG